MTALQRYSSRWDLALDAPEIEGQFNCLEDTASVTLFNSLDWLQCYQRFQLRETQTQVTLSVWSETRLVALVALVVGRETIHGVNLRVLRLLGDPLADRCPLLLSPEPGLLAFVMDAIKRSPQSWDLAIFSEQPEDRERFREIDRWIDANRMQASWQLTAQVPVLESSSAKTQQHWSKSLRTRIRRSRNRIDKAGSMSIEHSIVEPEQVEQLLPIVVGVENESWKGEEGVGIFSSADKREFFTCLSNRLARRRQLFISVLKLDGRVISYRYGFLFRNRFLDYNLAFLPEFSRLGAGRVLFADIIEHAGRSDWTGVDASRASLKSGHMLSEWPVRHLAHHRLWLFNSGLKAKLLALIVLRIKPIVRRMKKSEPRTN